MVLILIITILISTVVLDLLIPAQHHLYPMEDADRLHLLLSKDTPLLVNQSDLRNPVQDLLSVRLATITIENPVSLNKSLVGNVVLQVTIAIGNAIMIVADRGIVVTICPIQASRQGVHSTHLLALLALIVLPNLHLASVIKLATGIISQRRVVLLATRLSGPHHHLTSHHITNHPGVDMTLVMMRGIQESTTTNGMKPVATLCRQRVCEHAMVRLLISQDPARDVQSLLMVHLKWLTQRTVDVVGKICHLRLSNPQLLSSSRWLLSSHHHPQRPL